MKILRLNCPTWRKWMSVTQKPGEDSLVVSVVSDKRGKKKKKIFLKLWRREIKLLASTCREQQVPRTLIFRSCVCEIAEWGSVCVGTEHAQTPPHSFSFVLWNSLSFKSKAGEGGGQGSREARVCSCKRIRSRGEVCLAFPFAFWFCFLFLKFHMGKKTVLHEYLLVFHSFLWLDLGL